MEQVVIAFSGSRDLTDAREFRERSMEIISRYYNLIGPWGSMKWVFGDARGVDAMAYDWALGWGVLYARERADWGRLGAKAGPERNSRILKHHPHLLIAFPTETSVGTWDMIAQAATWNKTRGLYHKCRVEIVYH